MKEMYFHHELDGYDVSYFVDGLGATKQPVLDDLAVIAMAGPELVPACEKRAGDIWEYRRSSGAGASVVLLFAYIAKGDFYIILHGVRSQGRATRSDLGVARRRRGDYP